jgi:hypothetical protein
MIHRLAASLAAFILLLTVAAPVLAGGWAEVVADAQTTEPPVEGQPFDVGFVVLQHGVTPAPWETATVHFTNASTGETIDVGATNDRSDGHFVVSATLPQAGYWSWQVTLKDLLSDQVPVALQVTTASGQVPAFDPATTATAIARANRDVTNDLEAEFGPEIARLDNLLQVETAKTDRLVKQTNDLVAQRDELATRVAKAEGSGGLPILAVVTLAVLAGAAAGFAMTWLAGRPGPTVTVNPARRGADPA